MIEAIHAAASISISDLKKNPSAAIAAAEGSPLAILNRNRPSAYLIPAEAWADIVEQLDDLRLAEIIEARAHEVPIPVSIDDL